MPLYYLKYAVLRQGKLNWHSSPPINVVPTPVQYNTRGFDNIERGGQGKGDEEFYIMSNLWNQQVEASTHFETDCLKVAYVWNAIGKRVFYK